MTYRERISLDGLWNFLYDAKGELDPAETTLVESWRTAKVPMPWQAQFSDLHMASGVGWYRRNITLKTSMDDCFVLHFGAADYHTTIWLNDRFVGEHEGGYTPFEFDITGFLVEGENRLLVRVADADTDVATWPDYPFSEVPHGKQSWYGPVGGLWQSVWLEKRAPVHIQNLKLTPDWGTSMLTVEVTSTRPHESHALQITILDPDDVEVALEEAFTVDPVSIAIDPGEIQPWSPDSPALYAVKVKLIVDRTVVDEVVDRCGFRTVEARDGRIYLNGEPIYLRGALDQAYYPETIYTPPSLEFLEDQARKAKAIGLNCLRIHIKVGDPRYYEVADRYGLLVWTEIPNWIHLSDAAAQRAEETFQAMVARDWNHPSIIAWTLINEDWGTDLVHNSEHRRWLSDFTKRAKLIDPTRLIVDNSACHPNFHVAGDLEDYHHYRNIPDHAAEWDKWVADFAGRADWAWADEYSKNRRTDLPLIVSEFGNWGLPDPERIKENGQDPWWFENGHEWALGIVYPHNLVGRYRAFELDRVFGDFDNFIRAGQEHMARSLAYEITSMRLQPEIAGYVITEFTDLHWECNGLMDMHRNIKQGLDKYFVGLNQNHVVTIRPQSWSGTPGSTLSVALRTFGVDGPVDGGMIRWQAGNETGEVAAPGSEIDITLPLVEDLLAIEASWYNADNAVIASSVAEVAVTLPAVTEQPLYVDDDAMTETLISLGYSVEATMTDSSVIVAHSVSPDMMTAVQGGANAVLIAGVKMLDQPGAMNMPFVEILPREGTIWQGDWATSFSWLRKEGPFAHLPGGPLLEMEYANVAPDFVLANVQRWHMQSEVWAGLALGWLHHLVSLLSTFHYGRGSVTVTTFRLEPSLLSEDVIAQALFSGMVRLAAGK